MSLIQEALKRKQEDAEASANKHPSLNYKGRGGASQQINLTFLGVILGAGFFCVVVLLLVLLFRSGSSPVETVVVTAAPQTGRIRMPAAPAVTPPVQPIVVTPEVLVVPSEPVKPVEPLPVVPVIIQPAPEPVQVVVAPKPVPKPAPPLKPVWPTMRVMGVLTNPDADFDSAIVNGRIRDPGEVVDGVKIISVDNKGALLGYMGETQFVKVGRSYPE